MSLLNIKNSKYNILTSDFVSNKSGNWDSPDTWKIRGTDGNLYFCPSYPKEGNNVYIEAGHTILQIKNESCKDLNLNATSDVTRIDTGSFKLNIYGNIGGYTGNYLSAIFTSSSVGIARWIKGWLRFTGLSRDICSLAKPISSNANSAGWTMEIDASGQKLTTNNITVRCGFLVVTSGELEVLPFATSGADLRIAGIDTTAQPGDLINAGTVLVKSGSTLTTSYLRKNNPTNAKNGLDLFTVEAGAVYNCTVVTGINQNSFLAYSLLGEVWYKMLYAQSFMSPGGKVDCINIADYSTVRIGGSGAKTLVNNITINSLLSLAETAATLALSTFSISYGASADLEYTASRTSGSELYTDGVGTLANKPRNLIVDGGVLTLNGNKTIRGVVILKNGGSINYNGFTLTTPIMVSKQSGNYEDINSWKILDLATTTLVNASNIPTQDTDIFIEAGHTITQTINNQSCRNLNLNTTSDVIRLNGIGFNTNIYGKLRFYEGTALAITSPNPITSSGILGWIGNTTLKFKIANNITRCLAVQGEVNANNNNSGHNIAIDLNSSIGFFNDRYRAFNYEVISGTLDNTGSGSGTISGANNSLQFTTGANLGVSDITPEGQFIARSGTKVVAGIGIFKKTTVPSSVITFETGSELETYRSGCIIAAITLSLLGKVTFSLAGSQNLLTSVGITGAASPNTYSTVEIKGSGAKTLVYNTTINTKFTRNGTATLALSSFALTYGSNADLEYVGTFTSGVEFPTDGLGLSKPRNLIVDGGVLTLNGNKTIRGTVIFKNGGSINYNGFTLTVPSFRTVQLGDYNDSNTWNIYNLDTSSWESTLLTPTLLSNIYIRHGVRLTQNEQCKGRYIKIDSTMVNPDYAINFQTFDLQQSGDHRDYSGDEFSMAVFSPTAGIPTLMSQAYLGTGGITVVGKSRTYNYVGYVVSGLNRGDYYTKINLDDSAQVITMASYISVGDLEVVRGILAGVAGNEGLRSRSTISPGGEDIIIRNTGYIRDCQDINTSTAGDVAKSFTIDSGGTLEFTTISGTRTKTWRTLAFTNNGTIIYSSSGGQNTLLPIAGGADLISNQNITFTGGASSIKTLNSNLFIKGKLSIGLISSISLNSKTITYDTTADLEITETRTSGNELPTSGSGVNIPRNLIIAPGKVYTVSGTKNIRGVIVLGAGASIVGTVNQNQP